MTLSSTHSSMSQKVCHKQNIGEQRSFRISVELLSPHLSSIIKTLDRIQSLWSTDDAISRLFLTIVNNLANLPSDRVKEVLNEHPNVAILVRDNRCLGLTKRAQLQATGVRASSETITPMYSHNAAVPQADFGSLAGTGYREEMQQRDEG